MNHHHAVVIQQRPPLARFENVEEPSVLAAPSTYVQARLDFGAEEIELSADDPPGFVVHAWLDGELVSHVQPVL